MVFVQMAPMRAGSPAVGALPLPRRLIRQIQRRVAQSGRSLQRLEVSGRVIDNFDDLDDSDQEPAAPTVASAAGVANTAPALEEDDDLTSLSWLQDKNLLRGINLTKNEADDGRPTSAQLISQMGETRSLPPSPTSDYTEETLTPETTDYADNLRPTPPPTGAPRSPPPLPVKTPAPYDPHAHAHSKPPYSFSCLIFMAIEASPARALPVKEIYAWIVRHFPYFREAPQGWKNSVRHNLSLNKCFHKVDKAPSLGKGSLWTVDPAHRATLVQAFSRAPVPPRAASPAPPRGKGAPDPQLFPFLARRLAGGAPAPAARAPSPPPMDEYLAAATVLAMKYGPGVLMRLPPAPGAPLVISSSPGEEHTYSGGSLERRTAEALLNLAGIMPPSPEQYDSGEESMGHRPRLLRRVGRRRPADEGAEPPGGKRRAR